MRLILKLVAAPVALLITVVTSFLSFVLSVSDVIFGIASVLVFIAAAILLATGELLGGGLFLAIAFLVSPLGLPALARWLVKGLSGMGDGLRSFLIS